MTGNSIWCSHFLQKCQSPEFQTARGILSALCPFFHCWPYFQGSNHTACYNVINHWTTANERVNAASYLLRILRAQETLALALPFAREGYYNFYGNSITSGYCHFKYLPLPEKAGEHCFERHTFLESLVDGKIQLHQKLKQDLIRI
jgi:hypothetical protein